MIEKALIILIFMYIASFTYLGIQYSIADAFGITMVDINGNPIKSDLLALINVDQLNTITDTIITDTNKTGTISDAVGTAASIAWELFTLLTGTYIFNIIAFFGVHGIWSAGFVLVYLILVWRAIIALIRGI